MIEIQLFGKRALGRAARLSDEDAELGKLRWYVYPRIRPTLYETIRRQTFNKEAGWKSHYLARMVWERAHGPIPQGFTIDHRNRDTFDNQRENLRLADAAGQARNHGPWYRTTSGFKGVRWHKRGERWETRIRIGTQIKHLGHYDDLETAARIYDVVALQLWGEYAYTNYPRAEYPDDL